MSNLSDKLLSEARRYCGDRFEMWATKYQALVKAGKDRESDDYHYTKEALRAFPRYNVLGAIQADLERLTDSNLGTIGEARETVANIGFSARNEFTNPSGPIDAEVMQEERQLFAEFAKSVTEDELNAAPRLPYKRVLSDAETVELRNGLLSEWGVSDGYWYPLAEKPEKHLEAYQDRYLQQFVPVESLRQMLRSQAVGRIFELREYGPSYELDLDLFDPVYNGAEGFWVSGRLDWIMYASHESSITIGGWLLDQVRTSWPNHANHIWQSPFFD